MALRGRAEPREFWPQSSARRVSLRPVEVNMTCLSAYEIRRRCFMAGTGELFLLEPALLIQRVPKTSGGLVCSFAVLKDEIQPC